MKTGYYESLDFNAPMTGATATRLVEQLAAPPTHASPPSTVLDVGCGWAELLLRVLERCPNTIGHGVDNDERLLDRAIGNAAERGLSDRVTFGSDVDSRTADLVINIGAEHVFGALDDALESLHPLVEPGGHLLLGTQIWERPPSAELLEEFGPLPSLDELIASGVDAGFRPLNVVSATVDDWDEFEMGFLADWEQVVMAGPGRATSEAVEAAKETADSHRASYLRRRGNFGFVYLTLGVPNP